MSTTKAIGVIEMNEDRMDILIEAADKSPQAAFAVVIEVMDQQGVDPQTMMESFNQEWRNRYGCEGGK